jgi:hypothetical protein
MSTLFTAQHNTEMPLLKMELSNFITCNIHGIWNVLESYRNVFQIKSRSYFKGQCNYACYVTFSLLLFLAYPYHANLELL